MKFKIIIALVCLSTLTHAEFIGKAEKAAVGMMAIFSIYSSKCGDLTPFGDQVYLKIVADQERKGRLMWDMKEFTSANDRMIASIKNNGLSATCDTIYRTIKAAPGLNRSLD